MYFSLIKVCRWYDKISWMNRSAAHRLRKKQKAPKIHLKSLKIKTIMRNWYKSHICFTCICLHGHIYSHIWHILLFNGLVSVTKVNIIKWLVRALAPLAAMEIPCSVMISLIYRLFQIKYVVWHFQREICISWLSLVGLEYSPFSLLLQKHRVFCFIYLFVRVSLYFPPWILFCTADVQLQWSQLSMG